jgi:hypothetical protein
MSGMAVPIPSLHPRDFDEWRIGGSRAKGTIWKFKGIKKTAPVEAVFHF